MRRGAVTAEFLNMLISHCLNYLIKVKDQFLKCCNYHGTTAMPPTHSEHEIICNLSTGTLQTNSQPKVM